MGVFHDEPLMQRYSMELYTTAFEFLVDVFSDWSSRSSWGRFRHSFDRKFFEKLVTSRKEKMADKANKLNREAALATQRHVRNTATRQDDEAMLARLWEMHETRLKSYEQKLALGGQVVIMIQDSGNDALTEMQRKIMIQGAYRSMSLSTEESGVSTSSYSRQPSP